jgi:hypothetical protein
VEAGQFEPDDLPKLARLAALESIAMFVDVRTDLDGTLIGERLGPEVATLYQASELFYETASSLQDDPEHMFRLGVLYEDVVAVHRHVESTLGELAGLSNQAAAHLRRVDELIGAMAPLVRALDTIALEATSTRPDDPIDVDSLRRKTRLLANDLVELIVRMSETSRKKTKDQSDVKLLEQLLDLVQGFERLLSIQLDDIPFKSSLKDLRRGFWQAESKLVELERSPELLNRWRAVRLRMNAVSDSVEMPRVFTRTMKSQPVSRRAATASERPIVPIYRIDSAYRSGTVSEFIRP